MTGGCKMITTTDEEQGKMVHCFFSHKVKEHQIKLLSKVLGQTKCCSFMAHVAYTRNFLLQDVADAANFQVFKGWLLRFM